MKGPGLALAVLLVAGSARAEDANARARELVARAVELESAGRAARACPYLVEAARLEPSAEAELRVARCEEKASRRAEAAAIYERVSEHGGAAESRAQAKLAELRPTVGKLSVTVAEDTPGLVISRDGDSVDALGTFAFVEAGKHVVTATAPGKVPFATSVELRAGGWAGVAVPPLSDAPTAASPVDEAAPAPRRSDVETTLMALGAIVAIGAVVPFGIGVDGLRHGGRDGGADAALTLGGGAAIAAGLASTLYYGIKF